MEYRASDEKGRTNTFMLGQFDLFITSRISDNFSMLAEAVVEAGGDNRFDIELERALLQYSANDYFNLAFGRYHTAIGYYNAAFHHGAWFETATGRPFIFRFEDEGGPLPIHNVGVSANGRIPSGKLGLSYVAEIGNGRSSRSKLDEPVQNVVDQDNGKAVNLGLLARPDWLHGLQAGFSVYRDRLQPEGSGKIHQTILAAHLVYRVPKFEFLNEFAVIKDREPDGHTYNTPGFYTQISRQFGWARPYFRYDYINVPDSDPILGDLGRRNGTTAGFRLDISEFAALKTEYQRTEWRRRHTINGLSLQLAFTF